MASRNEERPARLADCPPYSLMPFLVLEDLPVRVIASQVNCDTMDVLISTTRCGAGSMPIEVVCECGKKFQARDEYAGRRGLCPACKRIFEVPVPVDLEPVNPGLADRARSRDQN